MFVLPYRLTGAGLACLLVSAELLTHRDLSTATALTIAQTALATCTQQGYRVSVTVVGRTAR
jgi:hypothetical protein